MDNISRRNSDEDTTNSMYLSFDAESTMSTACYKTLETMSDTSNLSVDMDAATGNNPLNSTLELHMNSDDNNPMETVKKKIEIVDMKLNTPLKALPKNILREYKALCSTPSKAHILKTVDVNRGSDETGCVDLGLAFLGIDDKKPALFPPAIIVTHEENKENFIPDVEEMSTLSTCSSVETITSVIEKKMCSMSTVGSITEEESVGDMKITEIMDKLINIDDKLTDQISLKSNSDLIEIKTEGDEITTKSNSEKSTKKSLDNKKENNSVVTRALEISDKRNKPQIAVLDRKARFSVCEPNLKTGKPSRIFSSNSKRRSLLPTSKQSITNNCAEVEIPLLINKMLKITDKNENSAVNTESKEKGVNQISEDIIPVNKMHSLKPATKARTSLISAPSNKRSFSFTQRMSVVVKTTLNSPARKIARRSALSGILQSTQRKNVTTQTSKSMGGSSGLRNEFSSQLRKSMVPTSTSVKVNTQPNLNTLPTLKETSTKTTNASLQKNSLYPSSKALEKDKLSQRKPDISYVCNICKDKFRIKSLLDAHKRSHENDNSPPAFMKRPSFVKQPLSGSLLGNPNQCKYCDKKFALIKALHIHLLQNCPKIPPSEKRKLQYTDLNHVEKAQLPNVFPNHNLQSNVFSMASLTNEKQRFASNRNKNGIPKTSSESLIDKKDKVASDLKGTVNENSSTASQTPAQKVKKISAHSGVYRTPSKAVPCHLCKLTFKSILDYTNHNLASHGNNKKVAGNDTGKDVDEIISKYNA